jgi:hypothetical protein
MASLTDIIEQGQTPFFTLNEKSKTKKTVRDFLYTKRKEWSLFPAPPTGAPTF